MNYFKEKILKKYLNHINDVYLCNNILIDFDIFYLRDKFLNICEF